MVHYNKHDIMGSIDAQCADCHTRPQLEYFNCSVCGTVLCGNCVEHARTCKGCGGNIAKSMAPQQQLQRQNQQGVQR